MTKMTKFYKRYCFISAIFLWVFSLLLAPNYAYAGSKYSSVVIHANTGKILFSTNHDKLLHPASLTKMMTLYLTFDALKKGSLRMDDVLVVSKHAASMPPSKLGLRAGSRISVRSAIMATAIESANDMAVVLGERLAGNEKAFALQMTRKARELGMTKTNFANASGLPNPLNLSTALDIAKLSKALIDNHPEYYKFFSIKAFSYNNRIFRNHNKLLGKCEGMDGLKTGYTRLSGYNLASSAVRGKNRLIAVVFGGKTSQARNNNIERLLDLGFNKINSGNVPSYNIASISSNRPVRQYPSPFTQMVEEDEDDNSANTSVISEGDIEQTDATDEIDTKELAVSTKNTPAPKYATPKSLKKLNYSIQIGAFGNRSSSLKAIKSAQKKAPILKSAKPLVNRASKNKKLYYARLTNISLATANSACQALDNCLVIAPKNKRTIRKR